MVSNNLTRLLAARKIAFQVYDLPKKKIGALETAHLLGVSAEIVYKTMVVLREKPGKPILAVVPGPNEVELKLLAAFVGEKKLKLATLHEAEQLTGLQAGGISPIALINRGFQTVLDAAALNFEEIHVSGGQLGLNIRLPVNALIQLTNAGIGSISKGKILNSG